MNHKNQISFVLVLAFATFVGCQGRESTGPAANGKKGHSPAAGTSGRETPAKTEKTEPPVAAAPTKKAAITAREVLARMVDAYRKAPSYADAGTARLQVEADGQKTHDELADFSLTLLRPNKIRIQAYGVKAVCDGKNLLATLEHVPGQVLTKKAPERLMLTSILADPVLGDSLARGFAGGMPQLMLLLGVAPLDELLRDTGEPELIEPGQIEGRNYYRVKLTGADGVAIFWIDQETHVLRRLVMPTDGLREQLSQDGPVDRISVVADFAGARFGGNIDSKAFMFEAPKDAESVEFFLPPNPAQLLSKKTPPFELQDMDGRSVTSESLAGKIVVLDFCSASYAPSKKNLQNLELAYQKYKNNPKVAFYAVSVDPPGMKNEELKKAFEEIKVHIPILRDTNRAAVALRAVENPITFILDAKGIVQDCEIDGNPKLAELLPAKLEKLLAGQDIFQEPLKKYNEQVEELRRYTRALEASGGNAVQEVKIPEAKIAKATEPTVFRRALLWKCPEVKSPGNVLVVHDGAGPARLLVVEGWKSVAEVGLDGRLLALHKLNLDEQEFVGNIRTAVGADGKRYFATFLISQQRCHVFDAQWNPTLHYPEDALKHPHVGIADVELGDLDGDGRLKLYVGYLGVVGAQSASLDGRRLWSNRSVSNVTCAALGVTGDGRRAMFVTNDAGGIVALDALGQRCGELSLPGRTLRWITTADLRNDKHPLWCGIAGSRVGDNTAVGFSIGGEELWSYALPDGVSRNPITPIVSGRLAAEGPGHWVLPGPDGSIHILSADGHPLDKFNYGAVLSGIATVEINGRPALVVASDRGLEAWSITAK